MNDKSKRTVSISFDKAQIEQLDSIASQHRRKTGENMTRSEVVRALLDDALNQDTTSSPACIDTPEGGRGGERSDAAAGGIQQGQGG